MAREGVMQGIIYIDGVPEEFTGDYKDYIGRKISRDLLEGPAICWVDGGEEYWVDGERIYGLNSFGDRYWYKDGEYHREDGPAVEMSHGYKAWYLNGKLHRVDGPACEWYNGDKQWWVNGEEYSEKDWVIMAEGRRRKNRGASQEDLVKYGQT
jgi:hypothetical protein